MNDIGQRKTDHIELAVRGDVGFRSTTTLFECVRLVHNSLPELSYDDVDLSCRLFGKSLRAPILVPGMTGGTERAKAINLELASLCEELGYAFGLGSQRAILKNRQTLRTYQVRSRAPHTLVLGNIGVVQAGQLDEAELIDLLQAVGADALCVHLNPAQELIQAEGDRDFRGGYDTLARLNESLPLPIVVKETGCGLSHQVASRLRQLGIKHVDVSGAGGTSWVKVEALRAQGERRALGACFAEWGIPTAASVGLVARVGFETVFATGGVRDGLDIAKAIALGATCGGMARGVLKALEEGGRGAAEQLLRGIEEQLRVALLLCGCKTPSDLREAPRVIHGELRDWLE